MALGRQRPPHFIRRLGQQFGDMPLAAPRLQRLDHLDTDLRVRAGLVDRRRELHAIKAAMRGNLRKDIGPLFLPYRGNARLRVLWRRPLATISTPPAAPKLA